MGHEVILDDHVVIKQDILDYNICHIGLKRG